MPFENRMVRAISCGLLLLAIMISSTPTSACSRVLYKSKDGQYVLVGRNMDWLEDLRSNIWIFPRGVARDGLTTKNPLRWTAKYGSLIVSGYDEGSTDGMNEQGLVANMLWLAETEYDERDEKRPGLCVSQWLQLCLDEFETVAEAVKFFETHDVQLLPASVGDVKKMQITVHLSLADKSGDSAVLEYIGHKIKIYQGPQTAVMTNSPPFDQQLAGMKQYKGFGGDKKLPGTTDAADRFVRAAFYLGRIPNPKNQREAIAAVLGVMRNVAQPFGPASVEEPNTSTTIWRTVADISHRTFFFESSTSPNIVGIKLDKLDFTKTQKLDLASNLDRVGDISLDFKVAEPFKPLPPDGEK